MVAQAVDVARQQHGSVISQHTAHRIFIQGQAHPYFSFLFFFSLRFALDSGK